MVDTFQVEKNYFLVLAFAPVFAFVLVVLHNRMVPGPVPVPAYPVGNAMGAVSTALKVRALDRTRVRTA